MTVTQTLDYLKRTLAQVRLPCRDGSHDKPWSYHLLADASPCPGYTLPLGEPCPFTEGSVNNHSHKKRSDDCLRCCGSGLIPRDFDLTDVLVVMAMLGADCSIEVQNTHVWAEFTIPSQEFPTGATPADADAIRRAIFAAAIAAARGLGALPKETP